MTVTVTNIDVPAGWTAASMLDAVKQTLINAGWMTDWHDSYVNSGYSIGILKVQYHASKTYGSTYYAFIVSTTSIYVQMSTGWDSASNAYTGTLWVDRVDTAPSLSGGTNEYYSSLSTSTGYRLSCVRSGVNTNFALVRLVNSGANYLINYHTLVAPSQPLPSWINLDQCHVNGLIGFAVADYYGKSLEIVNAQRLRASAFQGQMLNANTTKAVYTRGGYSQFAYRGTGSRAGETAGYNQQVRTITLPSFASNVNPLITQGYAPVVTGCPYSTLTTDLMPDDIGLWAPNEAASYAEDDIIQITPGSNEWRVIIAGPSGQADHPSIYLLGRTV